MRVSKACNLFFSLSLFPNITSSLRFETHVTSRHVTSCHRNVSNTRALCLQKPEDGKWLWANGTRATVSGHSQPTPCARFKPSKIALWRLKVLRLKYRDNWEWSKFIKFLKLLSISSLIQTKKMINLLPFRLLKPVIWKKKKVTKRTQVFFYYDSGVV